MEDIKQEIYSYVAKHDLSDEEKNELSIKIREYQELGE